MTPNFLLVWLKFQLHRLPGSGSSVVGDNKQQLGKLEASLAPAKAEVGAVVKADQK